MTLANKPSLYEMTMPDDDQHMLKLLKVKSTDVGEMTFVASNEYGSDSCTFIVEMAGDVPKKKAKEAISYVLSSVDHVTLYLCNFLYSSTDI